ncbi:MAG: SDR family oxidoreductase [Planctomycetota bacterium]|nr:SDR family oxidoreductase [Planctomycetota bacterium]
MLHGQTAIISGGMGDIGRAIARELARQGAHVALGDLRDPADVGGFLRELESREVKARYDKVDVSDAAAVKDWVAAVEASVGAPSLIVPNAAVVTPANFRTVTPEAWTRELRVNLDGAFFLAQAATLRLLDLHKPGRVVFVGSWAAHAPHTHIPAYCASKAGLRMLMRCMALELAPHGILVNEVAPGYVDAGLSGRFYEQDPKLRKRALETVPVGQLIQPDDVAAEVARYCDARLKHVTGHVQLMDGGLSLLSAAFRGEDA